MQFFGPKILAAFALCTLAGAFNISGVTSDVSEVWGAIQGSLSALGRVSTTLDAMDIENGVSSTTDDIRSVAKQANEITKAGVKAADKLPAQVNEFRSSVKEVRQFIDNADSVISNSDSQFLVSRFGEAPAVLLRLVRNAVSKERFLIKEERKAQAQLPSTIAQLRSTSVSVTEFFNQSAKVATKLPALIDDLNTIARVLNAQG